MNRTTLCALSVLSLLVSAPVLRATSTWTCSAVSAGIPTAINNAGQIVGRTSSSTKLPANGRAGFLQNPDGSITSIAYPGTTDLELTVPGGINNLGEVAGYYIISGNVHGFIRRANGDYESFDLPTASPNTTIAVDKVQVGGINDSDDISFSYIQINHDPSIHDGFMTFTVVVRHRDNSFTTIFSAAGADRPGPQGVGPINNAGTLLVEEHGTARDGYLQFADGATTSLRFPGLTTWMSTSYGLNNNNETAGFDFHQVGFVGSLNGGLQSVVCPDSPQGPTEVVALNDQRRVVGTLVGDTDSGFIATPTGLTADLVPSNDSWTFSPNPVGVPGGSGRIYLNSNGPADVNVTSIYVGDASVPGSFALTGQTCTQTGTRTPTALLRPGDWCSMDFQFTPKIGGWQTAAIYVVTDSPSSPIVIPIGGMGLGANLQISNANWQFGSLPLGQSSGNGVIYIYNKGGAAADLGIPQIVGANPGDFAVVPGSCGSILPAYQTCSVAFNFTPTAPGQRQATLQISTNADQGTVSLPLGGYGY